MSDLAWMFVAFAAVAAGIGGYLASLTLRRRAIERRIAALGHGTILDRTIPNGTTPGGAGGEPPPG